jgi:hypothetical protein
MADTQYMVLYESKLGLPWRQATEAQREKAMEAAKAMMDKWKAAGIERIMYIQTQSTEYPHHWILKLKSADQFRQMAQDIDDAKDFFKFVEKFNISLGWGAPQ